ncbi:S41 family peptidase, partial [Bacteroides fragilis]|nr:S41 family peptidase [Bacteroides fragilis]
ALWGKGILCLRRFCYARNMYNKMNFCRFTSKIPRNPIGCGFEDTDIISPLTKMFVPPNSFFAYSTYSDTRFPGMLRYHRSSSSKIGSENYYKGRIIILVNEWTRSFSEYLTMALQVNPRSITVGNSTSGSDGNVSLFTFPGKVLTAYSGIGIYYPDFSPTQRVGVRIDCIAEPSIQSIKDRIDVAYERAVIIAKGGTY